MKKAKKGIAALLAIPMLLLPVACGESASNGLPFDAMLPLIDEAARKVHRMTPAEAQTGPARRGDENVMNAHKAMLDDELANVYETLSNYIMKRNG